MPSDAGFVAIRPQMEAVDAANESDLESVLTVAEWEKLEDVSNLREFSYITWTDEVFQGNYLRFSMTCDTTASASARDLP
jgi:hypothetical protein